MAAPVSSFQIAVGLPPAGRRSHHGTGPSYADPASGTSPGTISASGSGVATAPSSGVVSVSPSGAMASVTTVRARGCGKHIASPSTQGAPRAGTTRASSGASSVANAGVATGLAATAFPGRSLARSPGRLGPSVSSHAVSVTPSTPYAAGRAPSSCRSSGSAHGPVVPDVTPAGRLAGMGHNRPT